MNKNWNILDWCATVILGAFVAYLFWQMGEWIINGGGSMLIGVVGTVAIFFWAAVHAGSRDL